jgi:hypothetical protein
MPPESAAVAVRFPMACPACSTVTAKPYMATADGATAVAMRCRKCSHEWRYDVHADTSRLTMMRSGVRLPIKRVPDDLQS